VVPPGAGVVAATHLSRHLTDSHGTTGAAVVVVAVVEVVVVEVVVVVVVVVVVLAHPPTGDFQAKPPPVAAPAIKIHSPWQRGLTIMSPGAAVVVVAVDSETSSGRSFVQVPFLCRHT
jgi:hypothetical protein